MANEELRELLKSQTLNDVLPNSFQQVGGVVFPDSNAASDLADFVKVVDSFRAVHLPTFGSVPIPNTTKIEELVMSDSTTSVDLVTCGTNEVKEIVAIAVRIPADYNTGGATLAIKTGTIKYSIIDLSYFDVSSASGSGVVYGNLIKVNNDSYQACPKLLLNGGETLTISTASNPDSDISFQITVRKYVQ